MNISELNKRKHDSGYYSAQLEQEFDTHGFKYMQDKYPDVIMCGTCGKFGTSCDMNVTAFEEACSKGYVENED